MSRAFTSAIETLLNALDLPFLAVAVGIPSLSLYITNWPRSVTIDGQVYIGAKAGADEWTLRVDGLSENLKFEAPSTILTIGSLAGVFQARMIADDFRGQLCTIHILYVDKTDNWTVKETPWSLTFRCDIDQGDEDKIDLQLASADTTQGEEYPRNANESYACSFILSRGRCSYRWRPGSAMSLLSCDHGYDTPNGCKAHHPDIVDPETGLTIPQAKPFGGNISSIDEQLVFVGG